MHNGWVVLDCVLDVEEVEESINDFWEWAECILGRDRASAEIMRTRFWFATTHGIIKHYNIGQSAFMWNLRKKPAVQEIFRAIWDVDASADLVTSFDGCSVVRPPEGSQRLTFSDARKPWFHVDQTPATTANTALASTRWGAKAIQGAINLMDSDEDDACFYILDKSHRLHGDFFHAHAHEWDKTPTGDFFMLTEEHIAWYEARGCKRMAVPVCAGSMTLWDSRLVHCSKPPSKNRSNPHRWRLTAFVCMMPRSCIPRSVQEKRRAIATDNRTTCHWPNQPRVNARRPRDIHIGDAGYRELEGALDSECMKLV